MKCSISPKHLRKKNSHNKHLIMMSGIVMTFIHYYVVKQFVLGENVTTRLNLYERQTIQHKMYELLDLEFVKQRHINQFYQM